VAAGREGALPLSFAQQRLWFIDQLEPGGVFYNVPLAVRLTGRLDAQALGRTLTEVVRRHEVLRTTFESTGGEPAQVIHPPAPVRLEVEDLSGVEGQAREAEAMRLAAAEARRPFDLAVGPLLRARLLRLGEEEHVALLTLHHIVSDGWSMGVLVREVAALYEAYSRGEESPLAELAVQYADFAVWQREWLRGEVLERQLNYWREQLAGAPPVLELPTDKPRLPRQTFRGVRERLAFPATLRGGLKALSRENGCTLFMTMLAAFKVLLYRYTQQEDILVGSAIANRNRAETEALIGFFVNTLVTRTRLTCDESFKELLAKVCKATLGAYAHQDVPFERLVEEFAPARSVNHTPLFQVAFGVSNSPLRTLELPGLKLELMNLEEDHVRFDLTLWVEEDEKAGGLSGTWYYNTDLFYPETIHRMHTHFATLLASIVAQPDAPLSRLNMLAEEEKRQSASRKSQREKTHIRKLQDIKRKSVASLPAAQARTESSNIEGPTALD
jgi:hypothetical protein